jgi:hypothetical protein
MRNGLTIFRWCRIASLAFAFQISFADIDDGGKRNFVRQRRLLQFGDIGGIISNFASLYGSGHGLSAETFGLTMLYYSLAHVLKPTNILIIGTGEGTVPVIFAEAMRDLHELGNSKQHRYSISVVDANFDSQSGTRNSTSYDRMTSEYPEIRIFQNFSQQIPSLVKAGLIPRPNIVMIDGDHSAVVALQDFLMIEFLLEEPSAVLIHDTLYPTSANHNSLLGSAVVVEFIRKHWTAEWAVIDFWFVGSGLALALPLTVCGRVYPENSDIPRVAWISGVCPKSSIHRGIPNLRKEDFIFDNSQQYPDAMQIIQDMDFFKKINSMMSGVPISEMQSEVTAVAVAEAGQADGAESNESAGTDRDSPLNHPNTFCIPGVFGDNCSEFLYQDMRDKWLDSWPYLDSEALQQRQVIAAATLRRLNVKSVFEVGGCRSPLIDFISHDLDSFVGVDPLIRPEWRSNVTGTADCLKCTIKEVRLLPCLLQDVLSQKFDIGVHLEFDAVVVLIYDNLFGIQNKNILHLLSLSAASILVLEVPIDWPSSQADGEELITTLVGMDWFIQIDVVLDLNQSPDLEAYTSHVFSRRRLVTLQRSTVPPNF